MIAFIYRHKPYIVALSAGLLILAFLAAAVFHSHRLAEGFLITASVLGVLPIALQAVQALRVKVVSIDVLVTLAVIGAFAIRNFEESAIVTFLFLFGALLEQRTLTKTRSAIKELTEMAPERAEKQQPDGSFAEVAIDDVEAGDTLRVRTGDKVPVDGTVLSGEGHINEAGITGEAVPVRKFEGRTVYAGTLVDNGTLLIRADRVGEDTTFGRIIELVEEAQDAKSEAERFIDRFSAYYTPAVLILGLLVWLITRNLELAITLLVLGCPGALVIGVPVSNVAGIGNGARHGILLKGSEVIRDFSRVDTVLFDKTGTLTVGNPEVAELIAYGETPEPTWSYLLSVEHASTHPLARAIVKHLDGHPLRPVTATDVRKGGGIRATVDGHAVAIGNRALMDAEGIAVSAAAHADADRLERDGNSLVFVAVDGRLEALVGIRDRIRPQVRRDLDRLRALGVRRLILLSGDNQGTVDRVAAELGLTEAHGHLLPEDKARIVQDLRARGHITAFVGDGVNDSPSLAHAHIGIAMGSGTDVAIETSDVVLMGSDLSRLPHALGLARATARNMRQNIVIAVGVVLLLLLGVFFSSRMNMSIGMFVHEASILVVILNGMRLLRFGRRHAQT